jgi:serine/threonine protein kinase
VADLEPDPTRVRVLGAADDGHHFYVVRERIHGVSLDVVLGALHARREVLAPELVFLLARRVAEGLRRLHRSNERSGFVHADVDPSNVLVSSFGYVKINDFTSCMRLDEAARSTSLPLPRRPEWHGPERRTDRPLDTRVDVFSFGVLTACLATGGDPSVHAFDIDALQDLATRAIPALGPTLRECLAPYARRADDIEPVAARMRRDFPSRFLEVTESQLVDTLRQRGRGASGLRPRSWDLPRRSDT